MGDVRSVYAFGELRGVPKEVGPFEELGTQSWVVEGGSQEGG